MEKDKSSSEVLKLGDEIEVKVLKYDSDKNRVSLGMKQLEEDPWDKVRDLIELGINIQEKLPILQIMGFL